MSECVSSTKQPADTMPLSFLYEIATRKPNPKEIDWEEAFIRLYAELDAARMRECVTSGKIASLESQLEAGAVFTPTADVLVELEAATGGNAQIERHHESYCEKEPWSVWLSGLSRSFRGKTIQDAIGAAREGVAEHVRILERIDRERQERTAAEQSEPQATAPAAATAADDF